MNEAQNPYKAPCESRREPSTSSQSAWTGFTWAVIGFAIGTILLSPLVLSSDPSVKVQGGMFLGGPLGALLGYLYGRKKSQSR
jgi:hypothetical protein